MNTTSTGSPAPATGRRRPYPRYKPSGVEWLGDVPEHWAVKRLKDVGALRGGAGFPHEEQGVEDQELPFYKVGDLKAAFGGRLMGNAEHTISKETAKKLRAAIIPPGSIVYAKIGAALLLNRRRVTSVHCCIDNNMTAYLPDRRRVRGEWAFYYLSTIDFAEFMNPGAVPSFSEGYQSILPLLVPPPAEQAAIADFLDRETGRLDRLVAKKRELIERLKEKRTALISRTVTRGLPPAAARAVGLPENPPLKPSGLDWLGDIPHHWEAVRLKHLLKLRKGAVKTGPFGSQLQSAEMMDDEIKVYNQRSVIDRNLAGGDNYISLEKFDELRAFEVFPNDLLVTTRGTIGRCAILPVGSERGILHPCLMRVQFDHRRVNNRFAEILIQDSRRVLEQLELRSNATTIDVIYSESLREVWFALPPLPEQAAIAAYLDAETAKLDALVAKVEEATERLQEYRTALITAAVTGKVDVGLT